MLLKSFAFLACAIPFAAAANYLALDLEKRYPEPLTRLVKRADGSFEAQLTQNTNKLEYLINVTVGTPAQKLAVTLDTGSSDLWIPSSSNTVCKQSAGCDGGTFNSQQSSTYELIDEGGFNITYAGPGDSDAGDWITDTVGVGGLGNVTQQIIGLATRGYDNHGVMGIGYDTNEAQPNPNANGIYPSVLDNLVSQGVVDRKAYSLYLNDLNQTKGSICFGCVDSTKYTGELVALPLQQGSEGGISEFFVTLTSVSFTDAAGAVTQLSPEGYSQSVLLDSGTSNTLLTVDVFTSLANGLGAVYVGSDSYAVPCSYANTNATVSYTFGGQGGPTVTVPLSEAIGGEELSSKQFSSSSGGCDFGFNPTIDGTAILGDTFLRNAYVVFDLTNQQVALAQAVGEKAATSSILAIASGTSIPGVISTATAVGTQLSGAAATSAAAVPTASAHGNTLIAGTPTFNLGASATSSGAGSSSTSNAAMATNVPQAALVGAGILLGGMLW